jgi:hypothetical protein
MRYWTPGRAEDSVLHARTQNPADVLIAHLREAENLVARAAAKQL